ncbi:unnamed protein product, partial [Closterium sp. NIES-54]
MVAAPLSLVPRSPPLLGPRQEELFELAGWPMVENCVVGYNSTLFTYGQTGSGKTYTMFGADVDSKADVEVSTKWGVIPCVFQLLFSPIGQIHKGPHGVFVQNLSRHPVHCFAQVMELIMRGIEHRKTAGTKLNKESSRSHCVFMCHITVSTADKPRCKTSQKWIAVDSSKRRFSQLNLVDLAGSESAAKSGAEGERLDEACNIKKSLLHLGGPLLVPPHSVLSLWLLETSGDRTPSLLPRLSSSRSLSLS